MIEAKGKSGHIAADEFPLRLHEPSVPPPSEFESKDARRATSPSRLPERSQFRARRLARNIMAAVQNRLPGRISDLKVRIEGEQFVLTGVSSSYYVKQMAQHIAMTTLEAVTLCQLVNQIEVRAPR
jgi:hypothetical protein